MSRLTPDARHSVAAITAVLALLLALAPSAVADPGPTTPAEAVQAQPRLLETPANGRAAIRALGKQLPEAAALNGQRPAQLRELLESDDAAWLDVHGRIHYRDTGLRTDEAHVEGEHADESGQSAGSGDVLEGFDPEKVFELSTLPGAQRTIYLDFDGHDATGTGWDDGTGWYVAEPFDADGDPTSFSSEERARIHEVWARVAEDFAPFAINVTTADPGKDALLRSDADDATYGSRLVVTSGADLLCSCGGVAYRGTFSVAGWGDYHQPAWVFTSGVGTGAKNIAEVASHEVGHNLGLSHDGSLTNSYYRGHNGWAPIMGASYYQPITQWSSGDYSGATNTEDDLSVMQDHGAPLVADDHVDTTVVGANSSTTGTIHSSQDTDTFAFDAAAGPATVLAEVADAGANLDIALTLRDEAGTVLASADPESTALDARDAAGLAASLSADLPVDGRYTVTVQGAGRGTVDDGYSHYASAGRYELHVAADDGTTEAAPGLEFVPVAPCAVFDTRDGTDAFDGRVGHLEVRTAQVTGTVPASQGGADCAAPPADAVAVELNLVAVQPEGGGNLQVAPAGTEPNGGVVNFQAGGTNSNALSVAVDGAGSIDVTVKGGPTHLRGVVLGYYTDVDATGFEFVPVAPCAVLDTRDGTDAFGGQVGHLGSLTAQTTGTPPASQGGASCTAPPSSAVAVALNLVAVQPDGPGNLQVAPAGVTPQGGVVNFQRGRTNSNALSVQVDADGQVDVTVKGGPTHVRGVVLGYYTDVDASGYEFVPVAPCALFDTREGTGDFLGRADHLEVLTADLVTPVPTGQGGEGCTALPAEAEVAYLNLVSVQADGGGNLQVAPAGVTPKGGVANFQAGSANSNALPVELSGGAADITVKGGPTHVRGVALGYYVAGD